MSIDNSVGINNNINMDNVISLSDTASKMASKYEQLKKQNYIPQTDILPSVKKNYSSLIKKRNQNKNNQNDITIMAVGDISFTRDIEKYNIKYDKGYFLYPLSFVRNYLRDSDVTVANLETLITTKGTPYSYKSPNLQFRSLPSSINGLMDAGINLVNLANNHSNDFGNQGLRDTIKYLNSNQIDTVGVKPNIGKIYNFNGFKVGFLGISRNFIKLKSNSNINVLSKNDNYQKTLKQIRDFRNNNNLDFLVLSIHWGIEYDLSYNNIQKEIAKSFIENGVNIVLGHHPHVLQNMDIIKTNTRVGYVFYSLGNFLFDSHLKKSGVRNTYILKIQINKLSKKISMSYLPCVIHPERGFAPIPIKETFQSIYPEQTTSLADKLYKYIECAKTASCNVIEGFSETIQLQNINRILTVIILVLLCIGFIRNIKK